MWLGLITIPKDESIKLLWAFIISLGVYLFSAWLKIVPKKMHFNYKAILYFPWLLKEICQSTLFVIKIIWQRELKISPIFEWIDAEGLEEIGEVIYANSITLTPGTVTLDVNNNMLLVHALDKVSLHDLQKGKTRARIKRIF
jgi:multicomponent Na+:H+ antiporter subunit E